MSTSRVGQRIRALRNKRGLTVRQLGAAANIAPSTITRLEKGERQPLLTHLMALSAALKVKAADLLPKRAA
jgi:transcriptional regulator with XRE-family HTH domain